MAIKLKHSLRRLMNYKWVTANIPFFLFLSILAVLYIANGHIADKRVRDINNTAKELKELQYEYKTVKSDLMYKSREAEMIKVTAPLGLKVTAKPPMHIIVEQKTTDKNN
jgi:Bacteriodetes cell division protein (FtsL-like)